MVFFDSLKPAGVRIFKHYVFALFNSHKLDFFSECIYKKKKKKHPSLFRLSFACARNPKFETAHQSIPQTLSTQTSNFEQA